MCLHHDEFKKSNTEVIIISFGTPKQARAWLEDTCSPFTMVLDRERAVYRAYGVKKSWLRSWTPMTAWFYVRAILKGRKLKGIQGDPHQLGGDFIVDSKGIVRMSHPSRFATDRPPASRLITELKKINSGGY